MTLGQKIRTARIERRLTQKQLVGDHITRNMLSKIENDSATPSVRTLEYISMRLQMPVSYFLDSAEYSDGTSCDGLDPMRAAYKSKNYTECIRLLEASTLSGTTDEGYLLHSLAALGAARECLLAGDTDRAKEFADSADYYNKEGLYYSPSIDAEMSLILAECALKLDINEFEQNAAEYERAVKSISFQARYELIKAEYLLSQGENELALRLLSDISPNNPDEESRLLYLTALCHIASGDTASAIESLLKAEKADDTGCNSLLIYEKLEHCYLLIRDYKNAHFYAAKQLDIKK